MADQPDKPITDEQTTGFVDIQKQVENIKKTLGDLKHIVDQLNDKSAVCKIVNNTDITLVQTLQHHDWGGFAGGLPPIVIEPHSAAAFGSHGSNSSLLPTGTAGTVHYVGQGMLLQCNWNVPYKGLTGCDTVWKRDDGSPKHDDTGRYRTWNISGSGPKAEMLFAVSLVPEQYAWRFCGKCGVLFFDGYPKKGVCEKPPPSGSTVFTPGQVSPNVSLAEVPYGSTKFTPGLVDFGTGAGPTSTTGSSKSPRKLEHQATGFVFRLSHSYPPLPYQQPGWRFCKSCFALFYDGYIEKGVCPSGGGHVADGLQFLLTNETPPPWGPQQQPGWRFCWKCFALFFDGYEDSKGFCPHGGVHEPDGFHFILNHV